MNILLIHNSYGKYSGEEAVVDAQIDLLRKAGHQVELYSRSSAELEEMTLGTARAFFTGLHNERSIKEIRQKIKDFRPDMVHVHNLYPIISPAVLPVIRKMGVPVVMTVHNYRLVCPNGLFYTHGEICERCAGKKEWNCILHNCEYSLPKSTGYALRNWYARTRKHYINNVDRFLCLTSFQKEKLVQYGIPSEKCAVLPNFLSHQSAVRSPQSTVTTTNSPPPFGGGREGAEANCKLQTANFLFAGRLNTQKGFDILAAAAALNKEIPVTAAGEPDIAFTSGLSIPSNLKTPGKIPGDQMPGYFTNAKALVFTSRSYEGFPMVFLEAMLAKLPVIAPRMAAFPEIIEDNVNGLLFEPGNAEDLAAKIRILNEDPELRERLGDKGYEKLKRDYSPERYLEGLMAVYNSTQISQISQK